MLPVGLHHHCIFNVCLRLICYLWFSGCGCCCDYRRAVIVIAIISIILSAISLVTSLTAASIPGVTINYDDDQIIEVWNDGIKITAIFSGIALVCSICALVGAKRYNMFLVFVNIVWLFVNYLAKKNEKVQE